jgi:tRNA dimethylallyltransferase
VNKKDLIVIAGATASGKTSLAVKIAVELSSEIISADSRQVFRKMDIGTGKDLSEYSSPYWSVPFHCIDIKDPEEDFTLPEYQAECFNAINKIRSKGKIPVIAGGSGLYIESVLKKYDFPDIPPDFELRDKLSHLKKDDLIKQLKELSPLILSKTDLTSRKRIIRAIEKGMYPHQLNYVDENILNTNINALVFVTRWDRDILVKRIEKRLDERLEEGLVEEVQGLINDGITHERLISFGLEYRYVTEYLNNLYTLEGMREKLFTEIRRFSKRQATYFRGMEKRGIEVHFIDNADSDSSIKLINKII